MDNEMDPERWRVLQTAYDALAGALVRSYVAHSWFTAERTEDGVRIFLPEALPVSPGEVVVDMMRMPNVQAGGR